VSLPIALSTWNEFSPFASHLPFIRVHVGRVKGGHVIDEDTGSITILGEPSATDVMLMQATAAASTDESETGPKAFVDRGYPGFHVGLVPVDLSRGIARLRLVCIDREPVRFSSRWDPPRQPEPEAKAKTKRSRRLAGSHPPANSAA
jgi:hypothetical protein